MQQLSDPRSRNDGRLHDSILRTFNVLYGSVSSFGFLESDD
jgi:hypothetical protein